jgi:hypothetical protein
MLHDAPGVHHGDVVGAVGHHPEVVRDQDHAHRPFALECGQEIQNLGLQGDVEPGGRFVGQHQLRSAGQGDGDHDPLAHAARQLVGVVPHPLLGSGNADRGEQGDGRIVGGTAVEAQADAQGLGQLAVNAHDGVERRHGVLEDDGHLRPPHIAELVGGERHELVAGEADGPRPLQVDVGEKAHDGPGEDGLARARLAHDAQRLAPVQGQGDAVVGLHQSAGGTEAGAQVLDVEQRLLEFGRVGEDEVRRLPLPEDHRFPARTSKRERSRSAIRFRATSSRKM